MTGERCADNESLQGDVHDDLEAMSVPQAAPSFVKQVREQIGRLGIQYIYYQFVSVTGRIVAKGIPADHWSAQPSALPARLRLNGQPVRRSPQELHRYGRSLGAGRHP